jgi:uncharacterized membrane protein YhaH (DUF805 family)
VLFVDSVQLSLRRYVDFAGRSRRAEYWWFVLFGFLATTIASRLDAAFVRPWDGLLDRFLDGVGLVALSDAVDLVPTFPLVGGLSSLVTIALLVPGLAVAVRRLHDVGMSGWWLLIGAVPFIGLVILVIFLVQPGAVGSNRFGPDPKVSDRAPAVAFA